MTERVLNEEQMMSLLRNSLLVAGHEMGHAGDHWPVVNATVHALAKDWENLKTERNVHAELRVQLGSLLDKMERELDSCAANVRIDVELKLKEMREIYDAYFADVENEVVITEGVEMPAHVLRAEAILDTLEETDEF